MIGLITKGVLQYQMYKYIPGEIVSVKLEIDVISGNIEDAITGSIICRD